MDVKDLMMPYTAKVYNPIALLKKICLFKILKDLICKRANQQ